jgi:hypothetical protein
MATQSFTADDERVEGLLPTERPQASPARINGYQLNIVASSMVDVVRVFGDGGGGVRGRAGQC